MPKANADGLARTSSIVIRKLLAGWDCCEHNLLSGVCIPCTVRRVATGTPATALLTRAGVAFTLHPYAHDPRADGFGDEAAAALGVSPEQIFKTLIACVDRTLVCAVVPVAGRLDLKALAAAVGGKRAELAEPAAAARATGYVVGGISPLGQKARLRVVLDSSARSFTTVFVSAGKRGLQVELAPDDLVRHAPAELADIAAP
ncbi:MAG: Cys-tRNA(Pro) deacylase [Pseudonocardiales bacterium]|nr:MAG: Cys-tRNA(Pro) deacylase [Pseudonocardiales bacterium]